MKKKHNKTCKCCNQEIIKPRIISKYPLYCANSCHYYKIVSTTSEIHLCDLSGYEQINIMARHDEGEGLGYKAYVIDDIEKITKAEFDKKRKELIELTLNR